MGVIDCKERTGMMGVPRANVVSEGDSAMPETDRMGGNGHGRIRTTVERARYRCARSLCFESLQPLLLTIVRR